MMSTPSGPVLTGASLCPLERKAHNSANFHVAKAIESPWGHHAFFPILH